MALIQTNKTMDAEIERLLTLRLDADGGIEFLVRTGNLKRRTGPHCLCAASEGDEEDSMWDDESDDDDDDEYPEAFVDAARRWNPNVYKSCTHPFGYVPFNTVPDID